MSNRSIIFGVGATLVLAGAFLLTGNPLSAREGSPSEPVVLLDAATTSIRWAGYSATTYNGSIGTGTGLKTANQICNSLYPGSHWANSFEILHLGTQYPWTQTAWLADFWYDQSKDCAHYSSGLSGTGSATIADTKTIYPGGINAGWTCGNSLYLACVYQP